MKLSRTALICCLLLGLLTSGCGYYFPHVYDGPTKTIYMPNWQNRTSQLGIDAKIYQELSRWFQKSKAINLTKDRSESDLILAGEVVKIDLPSVSWDTDDRANEAKVVLMVRYILKDIKTDEVLWEVPREIWTEAFSTVGSSGDLTVAEQEALTLIITDVSEKIYLGTLDKLRKSNRKVVNKK